MKEFAVFVIKIIYISLFLFSLQSYSIIKYQTTEGDELLTNNSFEDNWGNIGTNGEYGSYPEFFFFNPNWSVTSSDPKRSSVLFSKETGYSHSEGTCQKIDIINIPANSYLNYFQDFNIGQQQTIITSIWIKSGEAISFEIALRSKQQFNPFIAKQVFTTIPDNKWHKYEITGNTNALVDNINTDNISFFLNFKSSGTLYLDDVSAKTLNSTCIPQESTNLLENPGFEGVYLNEGTNTEYPVSYFPNRINSPVVDFKKEIANPHRGLSCQKIDISFVSPSSLIQYYQGFTVGSNKEILASIWIRTDQSQTVESYLRSETDNNIIAQQEFTTIADSKWHKYQISGYTGNLVNNTTDNFVFLLNFKTVGTVFLDDASVRNISDNGNLLENSGFERDYGHEGVTGNSYGIYPAPYFINPNWGNASTVIFSENTYAPHNGSSCQQINITNIPSNSFVQYSQSFTSKKNKALMASIWVKTSESETFELYLRSKSGSVIAQQEFTTIADGLWHKYQVSGYTGNLGNDIDDNLIFLLNFKTEGNILIDDAGVNELKEGFNMLENPCMDGDYFNQDNVNTTRTISKPNSYNFLNSTVSFSKETINPHSGYSCQKIDASAVATYPDGFLYYFQEIKNVLPYRIYRVSAWVKGEPGQKPVINFSLKSDLDFEVNITSTITKEVGDTWSKIEVEGGIGTWSDDVQPPTNRELHDMLLHISFRKPGILYVDDISVEDITDSVYNKPIRNTSTIPSDYFGIHHGQFSKNFYANLPNIDHGMIRLWDCGAKWSETETSQNIYRNNNFEGYKELIDEYNSANIEENIKVIYTLGSSPGFYSFPDDIHHASPPPSSNFAFYTSVMDNNTGLQAWKNYVSWIVTEYGGLIDYYEIWNEVETFYTDSNGRLNLYQLSEAAYDIIKTSDPNAKVLSPNFTRSHTGNPGLSASDFLHKSFQNGNLPFDIFSFHKYSEKKPENEVGAWHGYRNMLDNFGLNNMPMWNTEGSITKGWNSANSHINERQGAVSRYLILQWAFNVENFNWYKWEPTESSWVTEGAVLSSPTGNSGNNENVYSINEVGKAYKKTALWLKGKIMLEKVIDDNNNWIITLSNGSDLEYLIWNPDYSSSVNISLAKNYKLLNLNNDTVENLASGSVAIQSSVSPVLISLGDGSSSSRTSKTQSIDETDSSIFIHPNPTSDRINIINVNEVISYTIFDISGRMIRRENFINQEENIIKLSTKDFEVGMYLLVFKLKNSETKIKKFIKK